MEAAGAACRSVAIEGNAVLAMAVSSVASATASSTAAMPRRRLLVIEASMTGALTSVVGVSDKGDSSMNKRRPRTPTKTSSGAATRLDCKRLSAADRAATEMVTRLLQMSRYLAAICAAICAATCSANREVIARRSGRVADGVADGVAAEVVMPPRLSRDDACDGAGLYRSRRRMSWRARYCRRARRPRLLPGLPQAGRRYGRPLHCPPRCPPRPRAHRQ
jgi:hypothetical protein